MIENDPLFLLLMNTLARFGCTGFHCMHLGRLCILVSQITASSMELVFLCVVDWAKHTFTHMCQCRLRQSFPWCQSGFARIFPGKQTMIELRHGCDAKKLKKMRRNIVSGKTSANFVSKAKNHVEISVFERSTKTRIENLFPQDEWKSSTALRR